MLELQLGGGVMRLSEAIRLGAMLKPQGFGSMRTFVRKPGWRGFFGFRQEATCAFGAAMDASPCGSKRMAATGTMTLRGAAQQVGETDVIDLPREWEFLYTHLPCPQCASAPVSVFNLISHLNDTHRWTRERTADWVETLEAQSVDAPQSEASIMATVMRD